MMVNIRLITVGNRHAMLGDPEKVVRFTQWLCDNPELDMDAIEVRIKSNGTYRIYDGRHRFVSYVLAEREEIPILEGCQSG